jgi:hypothetical protein
MVARMAGLKRENAGITCIILLGFCVAAYIANVLIPYNYMFLMAGDGTPYDILYNLVGGNKILYPVSVVGLFFLYIGAFYFAKYLTARKKKAVATR